MDLEIESKKPLRSLARELCDKISVMFFGRMKRRYCPFFEIPTNIRSQDATIDALCKLIEGLSPNSRKLWDGADRKEFDIGYDSRLASELANRFTIRAKTVQRVSKLGASLAVTFYGEGTTLSLRSEVN